MFNETQGSNRVIVYKMVCDAIRNYYLEHSASCEAYGPSASQGIPRILWNLEAQYHIHKSPPRLSLSCARYIQCMPHLHTTS